MKDDFIVIVVAMATIAPIVIYIAMRLFNWLGKMTKPHNHNEGDA